MTAATAPIRDDARCLHTRQSARASPSIAALLAPTLSPDKIITIKTSGSTNSHADIFMTPAVFFGRARRVATVLEKLP